MNNSRFNSNNKHENCLFMLNIIDVRERARYDIDYDNLVYSLFLQRFQIVCYIKVNINNSNAGVNCLII